MRTDIELEQIKITAQIEILKKLIEQNAKINKQKLVDELKILITNQSLLDIEI